MTDFLDAVARGLPLGCVFALVAVGLVLTYRTAGVFNLAFGAQAFLSAAVYYDLRSRHEWPIWAAFAVAVLVVAPLLGLLLDRALFRHLRTAPQVAKLVTCLGLLVAIPQLTRLWLGSPGGASVKGIWPWNDATGRPSTYRFGDVVVSGDRLAAVIVTVILVGALMALFRWSRLGLRMKASGRWPGCSPASSPASPACCWPRCSTG
jgi:branched-subunit amino acid ABC-type transport system permease component